MILITTHQEFKSLVFLGNFPRMRLKVNVIAIKDAKIRLGDFHFLKKKKNFFAQYLLGPTRFDGEDSG